MVKIIGNKNSLLNRFIAEIRSVEIQGDSMRFRRNLERMGEVFAYEISREMSYAEEEITTPLGKTNIPLPTDKVVLAAVLRAGLPLHNGLLNYFDTAENAFVSAFRKYHKEGFDIKVEYLSCPSLEDKVLIIADPMLASGSSMVLSYKALMEYGTPKHIHVVTCIASAEGVAFTKKNLPANITIWAGAVDDELTAQAYIVPGLGDAGDLAFGKKE